MPLKIDLAIDLMGAESRYQEVIQACQKFLQTHNDVRLTVIGTAETLAQISATNLIKLVAATEISQNDTVISARHKTNSSMHLGLQAVAKGGVDGFLSAGNTNVFVSLAYSIIGLEAGVLKPAFMPFIPTAQKGCVFNMLDVGANLQVNALELTQFAHMAVKFNQQVLKKPHPTVGILNIGTEAYKGFSYHHEADQILRNDPSINYIGFVESRNLLNYVCDIVVCDGYAGNLVLKAMEGTGLILGQTIKKYFQQS